jgi:hypothetical protein
MIYQTKQSIQSVFRGDDGVKNSLNAIFVEQNGLMTGALNCRRPRTRLL